MLLSRLSMLPPLAIFFEWLPFRFPFSLAWLTSCPDRSPLFFLFQVVVTRGGMRRSASPRDAPHRIRSFLPLRLGFSSTWPTATRGNAGFNLEHYHQLTYEAILHRHDRLSKRSQATLKPTKRGAASISPASGKRGWMASFNCDEGEKRRFNLAHHHQLTYEPILHHHDRLTNRFQVIKGHFSGELRRCYRAPVGFVFFVAFHCAGRPMAPPNRLPCPVCCRDRIHGAMWRPTAAIPRR